MDRILKKTLDEFGESFREAVGARDRVDAEDSAYRFILQYGRAKNLTDRDIDEARRYFEDLKSP